jgi:hypothetical protein
VQYTVTGPNSSSILNQSLPVTLQTGPSLGFIPLSLKTDAVTGTYTFQATITYKDNNNSTQTSTLSTTFIVSNSPSSSPNPSIAVRTPAASDINLVFRSSYSPGESMFLYRFVYSSFPTPVTGTVRYQVKGLGATTLLDTTVNTTFNPGMNASSLGIVTSASIPAANYTFIITATAQSQSATGQYIFAIAGAVTPVLSEKVPDASEKPYQYRMVNDGLELLK